MMRDDDIPSTSGEEIGGNEGGRLYNPYADLYPGLNTKSLENIYKLPNSPEFLFKEEAAVERRSFGENMIFSAGCGYLAGAVFGGVRGVGEGLRLREEGDTRKIRINRVLNASGHHGRASGNALGVLGLLYGTIEGGVAHYRGTDDFLNSVTAGLATGAVYKAASGPRVAVIASAVGGIAAAGLTAGKHLSKRYLAI